MKKIIFPITTLLLLVFSTVSAQRARTLLTYDVGFTMGDLGDFISKPSFRGVSLDFYNMVNEKLGVGGGVSWNVFYEAKDFDTYTKGTTSLSGKQYRYSNHFPMLAHVNYYLNPGQRFNSFIGLGTGVMYTRRNTDMNLYTIEQEAWQFALAPQIGFELENDLHNAFTVLVKYMNGFKSGDFELSQSYLSLNVGWTFKS